MVTMQMDTGKIPEQRLNAIRKITGDFYDNPPSVWAGTVTGNTAAALKITAADRCVMRWLYKNSRRAKNANAWTVTTSIKEMAEAMELDRVTVTKSLGRLNALGTIHVKKGWNSITIEVVHVEEDGPNGLIVYGLKSE